MACFLKSALGQVSDSAAFLSQPGPLTEPQGLCIAQLQGAPLHG